MISLAPFATLLFTRAWTSFPLQVPELTKLFSQPFDLGTLLRSHLIVTPSPILPRTPGFSPPRGLVTKCCLLTLQINASSHMAVGFPTLPPRVLYPLVSNSLPSFPWKKEESFDTWAVSLPSSNTVAVREGSPSIYQDIDVHRSVTGTWAKRWDIPNFTQGYSDCLGRWHTSLGIKSALV